MSGPIDFQFPNYPREFLPTRPETKLSRGAFHLEERFETRKKKRGRKETRIQIYEVRGGIERPRGTKCFQLRPASKSMSMPHFVNGTRHVALENNPNALSHESSHRCFREAPLPSGQPSRRAIIYGLSGRSVLFLARNALGRK